MAKINHRSCSQCRHWLSSESSESGQCRAVPPTTSLGTKWPITLKEDWCGMFAPSVAMAGSAPRVSDAVLIEMVKDCVKPLVHEGKVCPPRAFRRADLVAALMRDGMARTPALKRIEKMVRHGIFKQGENPWPKSDDQPGLYIWMEPEAAMQAPEPKDDGNTEGQFLEAVRAFTGSRENACSLRSIHRQLEDVMPMSLATVSRKMAPLVSAGLVTVCDEGYYAEATAMEVDA